MKETPVTHYHLDYQTAKRLFQNLKSLPYPEDPSEYTYYLSHLRQLFHTLLPLELQRLLRALCEDASCPPVLIIDGLPGDADLPETPDNGLRSRKKKTHVSEGMTLGFGTLLGTPFAYRAEKGDEIVHDICPTKAGENSSSNASSSKPLALHTELAALDFRADYLLLNCLRAHTTDAGGTVLSSVREAVANLTPQTIEELRTRQFHLQVPESMGGKRSFTGPHAVLEGPDHAPRARVAFYNMHADTERGQAALRALKFALVTVSVTCVPKPGQLVIFSNDRIVHGRRSFPFETTHDQARRWLQRVMVSNRLYQAPVTANQIIHLI